MVRWVQGGGTGAGWWGELRTTMLVGGGDTARRLCYDRRVGRPLATLTPRIGQDRPKKGDRARIGKTGIRGLATPRDPLNPKKHYFGSPVAS